MILSNKLGIINEDKLFKEEERISKLKAIKLFNLDIEVGTFKGLQDIHRYLFEDIYEFAR